MKKSEIKLIMLSLSVHTVVSLYIINAQHVTIDLINMFFVGGTRSEVEIVPQHPTRSHYWSAIFGLHKISTTKVMYMNLGLRELS